MISRPSTWGPPDRVSPECGADTGFGRLSKWCWPGHLTLPSAGAIWCLLNAVLGPVIWAAHAGVRLKKIPGAYRFVSCGPKGLSLRYGGRLRFDLGEKAGLPSICSLKTP